MKEPVVLRYRISDRVVTAQIDDASLLEPLEGFFPDYRAAEAGAPGADPCRVRVSRSTEGFLVLGPRRGEAHHCSETAELLNAYEYSLSTAFLEAFADVAQLHASGAVVDGAAVLAVGPAGAGKTSIAFALLVAGHPTLGDDIVFISRERHALAFRRLFKVHAKTLVAAGVEPAGTPFWDPGEPEAWYDPRQLAGWAEPAGVGLLVLPRFRPGAALHIEDVERSQALNVLLHSLIEESGLSRRESFDILADLAEAAPAYRLTFGSAAQVEEAVRSLMR